MLDRYSAEARKAVEHARDEAARLGHPYVGTEHLLLGLLAEGGSAAARSLNRAGASLPLCREKVTEALASRSGKPAGIGAGELELTDRASRALDRAGKLSARLKCDRVEPAHVLLSVLDVEGTAGQVLRGLAVDLGSVRKGLSAQRPGSGAAESGVDESSPGETGEDLDFDDQTPDGSPAPAEPPSVEPLCPGCGGALRGSLGRSVVSSLDGIDFDVAHCAACGTTLGLTRSPAPTARGRTPGRASGTAPSRDPGPPRPRRRRA